MVSDSGELASTCARRGPSYLIIVTACVLKHPASMIIIVTVATCMMLCVHLRFFFKKKIIFCSLVGLVWFGFVAPRMLRWAGIFHYFGEGPFLGASKRQLRAAGLAAATLLDRPR